MLTCNRPKTGMICFTQAKGRLTARRSCLYLPRIFPLTWFKWLAMWAKTGGQETIIAPLFQNLLQTKRCVCSMILGSTCQGKTAPMTWALRSSLKASNISLIRSTASMLDSLGTQRKCSWIEGCPRDSAILINKTVNGHLVDISLFMEKVSPALSAPPAKLIEPVCPAEIWSLNSNKQDGCPIVRV